eukprot:7367893-Alexandrium_andersonii.AAC.1
MLARCLPAGQPGGCCPGEAGRLGCRPTTAADARATRRGRQNARPEAPAGAPPTAAARQSAGAAIA